MAAKKMQVRIAEGLGGSKNSSDPFCSRFSFFSSVPRKTEYANTVMGAGRRTCPHPHELSSSGDKDRDQY